MTYRLPNPQSLLKGQVDDCSRTTMNPAFRPNLMRNGRPPPPRPTKPIFNHYPHPQRPQQFQQHQGRGMRPQSRPYHHQNNPGQRQAHPPSHHQHQHQPRGQFQRQRPFIPNAARGGGGGRRFNFRPGSSLSHGQQRFPNPGNPGQQTAPEDSSNSPWLTPDILQKIKEKEEAWMNHSQQRTEESQRLFKIKQFEAKLAVNDAKIIYFQKNPSLGQYSPYAQYSPSPRPYPRTFVRKQQFYCGPCDKDFISQETLDEHTAEHITCKLDGCTYTAHAKLVMKHIEIQHSTNLFHRIKGYDTPEEIEKWKDERRKNFPTPTNLERKIAERTERKFRGEIIDISKPFKRMEEFRYKIIPENRKPKVFRRGPEYQSDHEEEFLNLSDPHNPVTRKFMNLNRLNTSPVIKLLNFYTDIEVSKGAVIGSTKEVWTSSNAADDNNQLKNFNNETPETETSEMNCDEFNITDDEDDGCSEEYQMRLCDVAINTEDEINKMENKTEGAEICNTMHGDKNVAGSSGLLGLANYASDSESELESEAGEINSDYEMSEIAAASVVDIKAKVDPPLSSDDEGPLELPVGKSTPLFMPEPLSKVEQVDNSDNVQNENKRNRRHKRHKRGNRDTNNSHERVAQTIYKYGERARKVHQKYSLLQRLLAPDIRKERNVVLQVCRFLVNKNFFEKENTATVASSEMDGVKSEEKEQKKGAILPVNDPNELSLDNDDNDIVD